MFASHGRWPLGSIVKCLSRGRIHERTVILWMRHKGAERRILTEYGASRVQETCCLSNLACVKRGNAPVGVGMAWETCCFELVLVHKLRHAWRDSFSTEINPCTILFLIWPRHAAVCHIIVGYHRDASVPWAPTITWAVSKNRWSETRVMRIDGRVCSFNNFSSSSHLAVHISVSCTLFFLMI